MNNQTNLLRKLPLKKFIEEIAVEYGVELFGNSDRVEDEE